MSRTLSVEQILILLSQLPTTKFGKIDWRKSPKLVARIVKALINSEQGMVTSVSKASKFYHASINTAPTNVHNQTLYAIMRGKTPDGSKEWPELREALSKMKCEWRGKTSVALLPVTSESLTEVFSAPEVTETKPKSVKKRKSKVTFKLIPELVKSNELSKTETKYFDIESKELVVVTTTRYTITIGSLSELLND